MITGCIVNKFRGDPSLFSDGMATIARHTGWQPLGLVPFFDLAHRLPAGDALGLPTGRPQGNSDKPLIRVVPYPRITNFDAFHPFPLAPAAALLFTRPADPPPPHP